MAERTRPGRGSDQFPLRLPDGLRDFIKAPAESQGRSMNAEIVRILEQHFSPEKTTKVTGEIDLEWQLAQIHRRLDKMELGL